MEYDSDEYGKGGGGSGSDTERDIANAARRIAKRADVKRFKVLYIDYSSSLPPYCLS